VPQYDQFAVAGFEGIDIESATAELDDRLAALSLLVR
jgi:hypothetical protein